MTGGIKIADSDELFHALAAAGQRHAQLRPWEPLSGLRPPPLPRPVPPVRPPIANATASLPEQADVGDSAVENATQNFNRNSAVEPVWQALLDVRVWRSRPLWWRLAASLVVRRL